MPGRADSISCLSPAPYRDMCSVARVSEVGSAAGAALATEATGRVVFSTVARWVASEPCEESLDECRLYPKVSLQHVQDPMTTRCGPHRRTHM